MSPGHKTDCAFVQTPSSNLFSKKGQERLHPYIFCRISSSLAEHRTCNAGVARSNRVFGWCPMGSWWKEYYIYWPKKEAHGCRHNEKNKASSGVLCLYQTFWKMLCRTMVMHFMYYLLSIYTMCFVQPCIQRGPDQGSSRTGQTVIYKSSSKSTNI